MVWKVILKKSVKQKKVLQLKFTEILYFASPLKFCSKTVKSYNAAIKDSKIKTHFGAVHLGSSDLKKKSNTILLYVVQHFLLL